MSLPPGSIGAFQTGNANPKPAPAAGIKPQQVGGVKFPGKINLPGKVAVKLATPSLPMSSLTNPALGAMFGLLFGRAINATPALQQRMSNPSIRDAAMGAAIAAMLEEVQQGKAQPPGESSPYAPRPSPLPNGWNLQ